MNILVVGVGLVGNVIACDLSETQGFRVTASDVCDAALAKIPKHVQVSKKLLNDSHPEKIAEIAREFDFVVSAVPGQHGYALCEALLSGGRKVVDIAFFPEDPGPLDEIAKKNGGLLVPDCGVAPGLSNLMIGYGVRHFDETEEIRILVGGLPKRRSLPFSYKAVFSPRDVIEEYIRPARMMEDSKVVVKEALSECELVEVPALGTLEAFNTDGLRSLLYTIKAARMSEKTMRYPGHRDKVQFLKDLGFFSQEFVNEKIQVKPIDLTSEILIDQWRLEPGEEDLTVMQVSIRGTSAGKQKELRFDLLDYYDKEKSQTSMSRTTGFTACAMVRAVAKGFWDKPGLHFPERLAEKKGLFEFIRADLEKRGVSFESIELSL